MKKLFLLLFLISLDAISFQNRYYVSDKIKNNTEIIFKKHHGKSRFGSYLSMNINYTPISNLFNIFVKNEKLFLKNRGEAHITVITPIEYFEILKDKISIKEISNLAQEMNIQETSFEIVCLGKGEATIKNSLEQTFFIVIKSQRLLEIRKQIQLLFEKRGGKPNSFNYKEYYPHITLGFTKRDLHLSDGVIKNKTTCYRDLSLN